MSNMPPSPFLDSQSAPTPEAADCPERREWAPGDIFFGIMADILALPPIDLEPLPAFLENPSWQYLAAVERGAA